jgi:hypothetical protein
MLPLLHLILMLPSEGVVATYVDVSLPSLCGGAIPSTSRTTLIKPAAGLGRPLAKTVKDM